MPASLQSSTSSDALNLSLHPRQWGAFESVATEILYGGAAGGGKSHLIRIAAIVWCSEIAGLQVYIFRRIKEDLFKNHMEGPKGFRAMLAGWVEAGWCSIVDDEVRFWNGSKIFLCHCEHEKHIYKYQGAEIHVLLIDELTHFTERMYRFLRNRVRMVGIVLPAKYAGRFPRILCGANPGNIGHQWVKATFVLYGQEYEIKVTPPREGGMVRQFIPARLEDNPSMEEDDPGYEGRLQGLGSDTLVKAMRWGDWNVVEGAFFECWSHKNIIAPFRIPDSWVRFRSGDWGSASPFSFGWWAVVQDDYHLPDAMPGRHRNDDVGARILPRGALVRYREWYGSTDPAAGGKGLKLTAEQVADGIIEREKGESLAYGVLDPSTFKVDGGPSIGERINRKLIATKLAAFREADNTRVNTRESKDKRGPMSGWDQMRSRIIGLLDDKGRPTGVPMVYCFLTCTASIRTIPVLQHDPSRAEDLDTESEDHAADDWRYACSSRPWRRTIKEPDAPRDAYQAPSEQPDVQSSVKLS